MLRFVIEVFRNGTTAKGGLVVREHSRASQLNVIEAIFDLLLCTPYSVVFGVLKLGMHI